MNDQATEPGMKFLDRNPPGFSRERVAQIANDLYGLRGEFTSLNSERDQNFRVTSERDGRFVVKLYNRAEAPGVADFQTQALLHIERQDSTLAVPRVRPTLDGAPTTLIPGPNGSSHIVRVLTYLEGDLLEDTPNSPTLLRNVGKTMARLDLALRGFFHPHARHDLLWDLTRVPEHRRHTHHIPDKDARQNVESVFEHFETRVAPVLAGLRAQVIHNDANGSNVLVDPDDATRVAGVLDFGDMLHGPLIVELAMACDLPAPRDEDPIGVMTHIAAGFDSVVPLEESELDLLYDLVLTRWAVTAAIIAWRRAETPEQPGYLLDYEQPCWESLARGLSVGREAARARLRDACKFPPYCPTEPTATDEDQTDALVERRHRLLGKHLSLFYTHPVHVEKGIGPWLYTPSGRRLLDAYNNVTQVGHSHPHVAKAIARQAATLSTNTRYLYRGILDYTERLGGTLPEPLSACVLVNSGSEANDIAWRMAKWVTRRRGGIAMEHAYHGITDAVVELSPYDVAELGPHVRTLMSPDPYRGPFRGGEPDLTQRYAADADRAIESLRAAGFEPAAFIVDTSFCSNGMPDVPKGYLQAVTKKVHDAGGLFIADEVQMGFGRPGTHMWGFEAHGAMPDIVTMGKPVGNGYPLGVVVTTPEILAEFGAATELFSTFGGNPVACAAGLAVLEVIEQEELMENARITGERLRSGIRGLGARHELVGDVRGYGLIAGVDLVCDRETLEPAPQETKRVLDLMCENGVLIGREGPHGNVLKIRPSLVFKPEHADMLLEALDKSLEQL